MPQISIVSGLSAGGGAYSPALTDWVVMTDQASMFLTGPAVVREALGEEVDAEQLGGTRVHQRNGVCHFVAQDDFDSTQLARELLSYLPSHRDLAAAARSSRRRRAATTRARVVPREPRKVYDVRAVIRAARRRRRAARGLRRVGPQPGHRDGADRRAGRSA